jgi:very-short-patch-repair endonuclease
MKREIIPYDPKLKALAKELRQNMTLSEVLLWQKLRNKQMFGYDFDSSVLLINISLIFIVRI